MFTAVYFVSIFALTTQLYQDDNVNTLKYVHVLFRHGHRTPLNNNTYPTDPHKDQTYYPYGFGMLTNEGKRAAYQLGILLRNRYHYFLGELYQPGLISAISSGTDRTSLTLAAVLAGLFPPKSTPLEWNKHLNWQPTLYKELSSDNKLLLSPFNNNCSTYHDSYKAYLQSDEGKKITKSYLNLFEYLIEHTKWNADPLSVVLGTLDKLYIQSQLGLEPPAWAHGIFPSALNDAFIDFVLSTSANSMLKQLTGGFLLKKIISDTKLKLQNKLLPDTQKMTLYSAHDTTISYFLNALEVLFRHRPHYMACVILQVHTINNVDGVKILYRRGDNSKFQILTVRGCTEFCPFQKFVKLLSKNVPNDSICVKDPECC